MVAVRVLDVIVEVPDAVAVAFDHFHRVDTATDVKVSAESLDGAVAEFTRLAVTHSNLLCLHAGVVTTPRGLLAVPGYSGLGKTTLTAALVQAGFAYVSDEVLAVDRRTGQVTAFPRPLGLAGDVWPVLDLPGEPPPDGTERLLAPSTFGHIDAEGGRVADIVLARRVPGRAGLELASSRGAAVAALLTRSFNHFRDPAGSFRAAVGLVRAATVWDARYESAPELAKLIAAAVAAQAESATAAR